MAQATTAATGSAARVVAELGALLTLVFGTSDAALGMGAAHGDRMAFLIVTVFWLVVTSAAAAMRNLPSAPAALGAAASWAWRLQRYVRLRRHMNGGGTGSPRATERPIPTSRRRR